MTAISRRRPTGCVVGIDQSYSGFAVVALAPDGQQLLLACKAFAPPGGVDRLILIRTWLRGVLGGLPPVAHIAMEDYAPGSKFGREIAGELGAQVKITLIDSGLPVPICYPTIVATTAVKKFATGKGVAQKSDMKLAVFKKWGLDTSDDNIADAYTLARIAHRITYRSDSLGYEADVLGKLRRHTEWHHRSS